jgi:hypothetical protein
VIDAARFGRTPGSAAGVVDGETVVVAPSDLRYHALNPTATAVWELLADGMTVDDAVAHLISRYEVDDATCRRDVEECLENFIAIGIAQPQDVDR